VDRSRYPGAGPDRLGGPGPLPARPRKDVRRERRLGTDVAFCDEDCSDIDLYLEDENGNEIDSNVSTDDVPIIECRPAWSGRFQIRVRMYECSVEPCYFGVGVFGRHR
jgi:hypothetical protein